MKEKIKDFWEFLKMVIIPITLLSMSLALYNPFNIEKSEKVEHQYYCNAVEQELDQAILKCDKELVKSILWKHGSCFTNKDK